MLEVHWTDATNLSLVRRSSFKQALRYYNKMYLNQDNSNILPPLPFLFDSGFLLLR
ncbi:hypothetical protein SAMN04488244_101110 [Vibrio hangzhouensis]|uniref:Uncharacterized protein n=1 Tax=Vibrio hangzhouensis TaxID=462991 RepID=A0A1H5RVK0_9VIBR|nr:hypothetical protein SAMN04488244_101110 [Vibrio hangzhouensis]